MAWWCSCSFTKCELGNNTIDNEAKMIKTDVKDDITEYHEHDNRISVEEEVQNLKCDNLPAGSEKKREQASQHEWPRPSRVFCAQRTR
jgi:hypothetical protein